MDPMLLYIILADVPSKTEQVPMTEGQALFFSCVLGAAVLWCIYLIIVNHWRD